MHAFFCTVLFLALSLTSYGEHRLPDPPAAGDFHPTTAEKVELGKLLFWEKLLSGNRNISCGTCHHPFTGMSDGLSVPIGQGGKGLSVLRQPTSEVTERVPRNSPGLYNLGAKEFKTLFHDGRVEQDASHPAGFKTPAGDTLLPGLENTLAATSMFPVTSATEMAGRPGENEIADAPDFVTKWKRYVDRLMAIAKYRELFQKAYPNIRVPEDVSFVHVANALAAHQNAAFQSIDSPFDQYLKGDTQMLSKKATRGMDLFYGSAQCSRCHSGTYQTDHQFHALGVPQIGTGKGDGFQKHDDFGRERVTKKITDRYRFRTPSLRNVALTAPYGHDGAFATLRSMVRHYINPVQSLNNYDPTQAILPFRADLAAIDFVVHQDLESRKALEDAISFQPVSLSQTEVDLLLEFLQALTGREALNLRHEIPLTVPSQLPVMD